MLREGHTQDGRKTVLEQQDMVDSRQGPDSTVASYTFDEPLHVSSLQLSRELGARVAVGR